MKKGEELDENDDDDETRKLEENVSSLVSDEDEFIVMIPSVLFRVYAGLQVTGRSGRAWSTAAGQAETVLLEHVESLLDECVL